MSSCSFLLDVLVPSVLVLSSAILVQSTPGAMERRGRGRLAGLRGVTDQTIRTIVAAVCDDPEEARYASRRYLDSEYTQIIDRVACTTSLPLAQGGEFRWVHADVRKLLQYTVLESVDVADLFLASLARSKSTSSSPWRLVLYSDEGVPGNVMRTDQQRKHYSFFFNFLEFGIEVLCSEN